MNASDKTLALLYSEIGWVSVNKLVSWTKYSNSSVFRKAVLKKLDSQTLIEFDQNNDSAHISPTGSNYVETELLKTR